MNSVTVCELSPAYMQAFIERCNALVTCSKDGYVRAWDLTTQHCFQIALGQQGEVRLLYWHHFVSLQLKGPVGDFYLASGLCQGSMPPCACGLWAPKSAKPS